MCSGEYITSRRSLMTTDKSITKDFAGYFMEKRGYANTF